MTAKIIHQATLLQQKKDAQSDYANLKKKVCQKIFIGSRDMLFLVKPVFSNNDLTSNQTFKLILVIKQQRINYYKNTTQVLLILPPNPQFSRYSDEPELVFKRIVSSLKML